MWAVVFFPLDGWAVNVRLVNLRASALQPTNGQLTSLGVSSATWMVKQLTATAKITNRSVLIGRIIIITNLGLAHTKGLTVQPAVPQPASIVFDSIYLIIKCTVKQIVTLQLTKRYWKRCLHSSLNWLTKNRVNASTRSRVRDVKHRLARRSSQGSILMLPSKEFMRNIERPKNSSTGRDRRICYRSLHRPVHSE